MYEHDVLELQVPMNYLEGMEVVETAQKLLNDSSYDDLI